MIVVVKYIYDIWFFNVFEIVSLASGNLFGISFNGNHSWPLRKIEITQDILRASPFERAVFSLCRCSVTTHS